MPLHRSKPSRRWHSADTTPLLKGWYEVRAVDDRWNGETRWRAWGRGMWWIQIADGSWLGQVTGGIYQWREPALPIKLDYPEVLKRVGREETV